MALTRNYAAAGIFAVNRKGKSLRQLCKAADAAKKGIDGLMLEKGMTRNEAMAYRSRQDQARRAAKTKKRKEAKKRRKAEQLPAVVQKPAGMRKSVKTVRQTPADERPHYRKGMSSKEFYRCWEWQTLRYEVLREHGCKCMHCGDPGNHVDHIKPRSKYPELELDRRNLQILCEPCNVGKSNLYEDDWRSKGV